VPLAALFCVLTAGFAAVAVWAAASGPWPVAAATAALAAWLGTLALAALRRTRR
jgi:hypothetical protein